MNFRLGLGVLEVESGDIHRINRTPFKKEGRQVAWGVIFLEAVFVIASQICDIQKNALAERAMTYT
jgi:hypothetical protein